MSGLSDQLFREVRPELFRVLAGPLARLYVDALDGIEREAAQRSAGIEREEVLALVEQVVEEHGDLNVDQNDPITLAATVRDKARVVVDILKQAGWLEEPERSDWRRLILFDSNGTLILQALRKIAFGHLHGSYRLAQEDIQRASEIATTARRCLTVENETSFHELAKLRSGELLVQTSYPGSGTLALMRRLPVTMEFWHFGDSDEAGFDILRVLRDKSGRDIQPLHMERGRIPFEQESLGRPTKPTWPFYERPRQN